LKLRFIVEPEFFIKSQTAENAEAGRKIAELMTENEIAERIIIGCAIKVHRALGPGLLESAYSECLHYEL